MSHRYSVSHEDSYGYRPHKSAIQALGETRRRCWSRDWVLEFDIKGLFDNIRQDYLLEMVRNKGICRLFVHPKSYDKLKTRLKALTGRSNGMGYERRKGELTLFIRGWVEYFKLADMRSHLERIDEWLRRRVRMCIWNCLKKVKTRFNNLVKCGVNKWYAWQHANTRKGYWRIAGSRILTGTMSNDNLKRAEYPFMLDYYSNLHRK